MSDLRVRSLLALLCAVALAAVVWLAQEPGAPAQPHPELASARPEAPPPIPPEHMPPPFEDRVVRMPDPEQPAASQTAAFCADENWSRMPVPVSAGAGGEFRVDADAWTRSLTGTRAGIASWMSQCRGDGRAVRIVAADSGALLATYDASSGLREP